MSQDISEKPQATSLSGKPLYPMTFEPEKLKQLQSDLDRAKMEYKRFPDHLDQIIALGRKHAALTYYREAVEIYTRGLEKYPDNPKLLRFRGHRYISLRQFDKAVADLSKAADLVKDMEDEMEPGSYSTTVKFNIWYHLSLAYYLQSDYANALKSYRETMKHGKWNDDGIASTSNWLYATLRRLGKDDEAQKVLEPVHEDMKILDNTMYHQLLMMYKGELKPDEVLNGDSDALALATVGYGVGNWYLMNGQTEKAREVFERVLEGPYWPAFGFIAAEAEMSRR